MYLEIFTYLGYITTNYLKNREAGWSTLREGPVDKNTCHLAWTGCLPCSFPQSLYHTCTEREKEKNIDREGEREQENRLRLCVLVSVCA